MIGYSMSLSGMKCEPVCEGGCGIGVCIAPNLCLCPENVEFVPVDKCRPICLAGCKNGRCVGPDQCQCDEGIISTKFYIIIDIYIVFRIYKCYIKLLYDMQCRGYYITYKLYLFKTWRMYSKLSTGVPKWNLCCTGYLPMSKRSRVNNFKIFAVMRTDVLFFRCNRYCHNIGRTKNNRNDKYIRNIFRFKL